MKNKNGSSIRIIHIFTDTKFSKLFFNFLLRNKVHCNRDYLFHYRCDSKTSESYNLRHCFSQNFISVVPNLKLLYLLFKLEKILIHCLASPYLLIYLIIFPKLAKKSYWVIFGKDLYYYRMLSQRKVYHVIYELIRKFAIKKIAHIITYNEGDYKLAKKWYKSNAKLHKSFMYPSNLYTKLEPFNQKKSDPLRLLVGNSADPSNNHLAIFDMLSPYKAENIELITPLSYGDKKYAKKITSTGKSIFGDKFKPIETLLPYEEYLQTLSKIDIGIFAHKRQQAMGNITTLIEEKKKVYLYPSVTTWKLLSKLGLSIYDIDKFKLEPLKIPEAKKNIDLIKSTFTEKKLVDQWQQISGEMYP